MGGPSTESVSASVPGPSETAPGPWLQIVDTLPMGVVYFDYGHAGFAANRFARNLLGLPSADLASRLSAEQVERLGIQLDPTGHAPPELGILRDVRDGRLCCSVTSLSLEGSEGPANVWLVSETVQAPTIEPAAFSGVLGSLPTPVSIGHEFNNLLGRVICLAEEIQDEKDPQQIHERAEALIETAERGADILRRLLTTIGGLLAEARGDIALPFGQRRAAIAADDLTPGAPDVPIRSLGR